MVSPGYICEMAFQPVVGDKYLVTWSDLGKPTVMGNYKIPGFGTVFLDDADVFYAKNNPLDAAFFVRTCKALGEGFFVTVSRIQSA